MVESINKKLYEKLGIKTGYKIFVLNAPENYKILLSELPENIYIKRKPELNLDFIHFFTNSRSELLGYFNVLKKYLALNGILWISWPKKSSKVKTDLDGNIVRETGLKEGLVDVKVVSVNEIWSGLKFVYRIKDRNTKL